MRNRPCFCDLVTERRHLYTELCTGSVDNDDDDGAAREPVCGDIVTKVWDTFSARRASGRPDHTQYDAKGRRNVSKEGEEAPAESFATAKLRADVARQQMRLAKDQLKKARKRFKEARREARHARKLAAIARRAWKKSRRGSKASDEGAKAVAKAADGAAKRGQRGRRGRKGRRRVEKPSRKPERTQARRRGGRGRRRTARRSRA